MLCVQLHVLKRDTRVYFLEGAISPLACTTPPNLEKWDQHQTPLLNNQKVCDELFALF
jgi:hypothetical protein